MVRSSVLYKIFVIVTIFELNLTYSLTQWWFKVKWWLNFSPLFKITILIIINWLYTAIELDLHFDSRHSRQIDNFTITYLNLIFNLFHRPGSVVANFTINYASMEKEQFLFFQDVIETSQALGKLDLVAGENISLSIGPDCKSFLLTHPLKRWPSCRDWARDKLGQICVGIAQTRIKIWSLNFYI